MTTKSRWLLVVFAACLMVSGGGLALAQGAGYTVVAVLPNGALILRGPKGVQQYDVPPGTQFNADGKAGMGVADLKPGMKVTGFESGIGNWKTTNVMVHEELNAEVVNKAGNTMLIRGAKGLTEKYVWNNANDITIVKDGAVVDIGSVMVGDRITGMVVQKAAPGQAAPVMTTDTSAADKAAADAAARKAAADKAAADAAARKAAADKAAADAAAAKKAAADKAAADKAAADKAAADAAAAKAASKKKLPKTASEVPLVGLAGALSLAAAAGLTAIRKSRSAN